MKNIFNKYININQNYRGETFKVSLWDKIFCSKEEQYQRWLDKEFNLNGTIGDNDERDQAMCDFVFSLSMIRAEKYSIIKYRNTNDILTKEGWIRFISGFNFYRKDVRQLNEKYKFNTKLGLLYKEIDPEKYYLENVQKCNV